MLCILTIFINHNTNLLCDCTINKKNVSINDFTLSLCKSHLFGVYL